MGSRVVLEAHKTDPSVGNDMGVSDLETAGKMLSKPIIGNSRGQTRDENTSVLHVPLMRGVSPGCCSTAKVENVREKTPVKIVFFFLLWAVCLACLVRAQSYGSPRSQRQPDLVASVGRTT